MTAGIEQARTERGRGREATRPWEIPWRGWRDIALRVKDQVQEDNLSIVAAGVAFYALLAAFPALAAAVSIYGLVADPQAVREQMSALGDLVPAQAWALLDEQLTALVTSSEQGLGLAAVGGALLSLWSATKGIKSLMIALNIAYDEEETRGFFKTNLTAVLLTLGGVLFALAALAGMVAIPLALRFVGAENSTQAIVAVVRWPLLALAIMLVFAVIYRLAPSRTDARWQWVSVGAVTATLLWLLASVLFSFYVSNFGDYNKTYGSLGAVIILLFWFYISAYVLLLGGELNAEIEHQTARDSTVGKCKPMGERGAYVADNLGKAR